MAYDLENTFPRVWSDSSKADGSSSAILAKYPYVCSRQALYKSIDESGVADNAQRNPNSYTVREITDKICEYWDAIMWWNWSSTIGEYSPLAWGSVINDYRWDQKDFWSHINTSVIAFHRETYSGALTAAEVLAETDIVFLPGAGYDINVKEYKQKPFLAFDTNAEHHKQPPGAIYYSVDEDDFGVELDVDGFNRVTGVTSGGITDDPTDGGVYGMIGTWNTVSLLQVYDYNYYHDDLNVNGTLFSVNPEYSGHNDIQTSTKWFNLSAAKFDVTISGGSVTAITPVARNDGNGDPVTGGWGYYQNSNDYQELSFIRGETKDSDDVDPRVLFRANTDQSGYSGNKATVSISGDENEFFAGSGLESADFLVAYAVYGVGVKGYAVSPAVDTTDEWYDINLPQSILPSSVRVIHERPVLTSTTRSLKSIKTGTGAHRIGWEFEYPPMTRDEATPFIDFFEKSKGAGAVQIYIPWRVMYHTEYWGAGKTAFSNKVIIRDGTAGSSFITLDGHEPGTTDLIPSGTYANIAGKTYKIFNNSGSADDYGRVSYRVEPPLIDNVFNQQVKTNPTNHSTLRDFYLVKAFVQDDVLDYTVDAAGLYRLRFKFVEAL